MDIKKLESKLVEVLNVSEDEKTLSLRILKTIIANSLKVGEAVKIENLGVFQLKEKIGTDDELTLLFSPDEELGNKDALFINLDIELSDKKTSEFSEDVFQLGINKRFIPVTDLSDNTTDNEPFDALENKINKLVESSTKLEDFDLWEDYLKEKDSTSILIDEETKEDKNDFFEDNITLDDDPLYNDDFEEVSEEELFDELMSNDNIIEEVALENSIDESNVDIIVDEEVTENIELIEDNIITEINENSQEIITNELEMDDDFENNLIKDAVEFDIEDNKVSWEGDRTNVEKDIAEVSLIGQIGKTDHNKIGDLDNEAEKIYKKNRLVKTKKSPLIYVLISGFITIGAIGIYYIFFQNPIWLYDKYEVEAKLSEQHEKEFEKIKGDETLAELNKNEANKLNSEKNENTQIVESVKQDKKDNPTSKKIVQKEKKQNLVQQIIDKKQKTIRETNQPKQTSIKRESKEKNKSTKVITASKSENEVAKNIYFDGKNYSIQISSWKQIEIAKREAQKLINKGYPAYVVKKYIAKLKSTWHRVRVGTFATLAEAKSVQRKLK